MGCTDIGSLIVRTPLGVKELPVGEDGTYWAESVDSAPEGWTLEAEAASWMWFYGDEGREGRVDAPGVRLWSTEDDEGRMRFAVQVLRERPADLISDDAVYADVGRMTVGTGLSVMEALACALRYVQGIERIPEIAAHMSRLTGREVTPNAVNKYLTVARKKVS